MLTDEKKQDTKPPSLAERKAARIEKRAEEEKRKRAKAAEELPIALEAVRDLIGADPLKFVSRAEAMASDRPGALAELEALNIAIGHVQKTALALRLALRPSMDQRAALENAEQKLGKKGFAQLKQVLGIGGPIESKAQVRAPVTNTDER